MQYKKLWQTILIVNFAKDSRTPFTSALARLGLGYGLAVLLGRLLTKAIGQAELPPSLPTVVIIDLSVAVGFILGGLVMLTMNASQTAKSKSASLQKLIRLMPLPRFVRWGTVILPGLIALSMLGLFGGILVSAVAQKLQTDPVIAIASWLLGLLSGYGLVCCGWPRSLALKGLVYSVITATGLGMFDWSVNHPTHDYYSLASWSVVAVFALPLIGLFQSYYQQRTYSLQSENPESRQLIPNYIPLSLWFLVKLWRNSRTRNSFLLALSLNILLALSMILRHKIVSDPYSLLIIGGILAATFAGDVRGVMRRHVPPEIVLVSGAKGIAWSEVRAVIICGVLVGLPMLFALHGHVDDSIRFIFFYSSLQWFSAMAGLLASTLLVPGAGESGTQFFTGVLATSALIVFPKFAHLSNVTYANQSLHWLVAGAILGGGVFITESLRRRNYGRT